MRRLALSLPFVLACATSQPVADIPPLGEQPTPMVQPAAPAPAPTPIAKPEPTCTAFAKPGVLKRSAVVRVADAGIGQWLAGGAEVQRKIAKMKFQGWEIRRLYPGDPCYQMVDLRPMDVVTALNGKSVERPEQAFEVLTALRTAPELVVEYLREGQPKKLTFPIVNE
jgi:S1-C subfamily serine protease